jgi:predicted NBD/HSP70 family sugar kinase
MAQIPGSADRIFDLLRELPVTTRTELVAHTGLSKATVSDTIAAFLGQGLVTETGKRQPGRGRSQVLLQLRADSRLVIGAEFNERGCRAVLADLRAGPIRFAERAFASTDPEDFVDALAACATELRRDAGVPVLGIGIGVPGLVDDPGREVAISVPFGWRHVTVAALVEARTELPTTIANRAKTAALGEYWQGASGAPAERTHLVYVTASAGIVAGLVIDGEPYFGHVGTAGELGHTTVEPDGPLCGCGNRGCLYMFASESAIVRDVLAAAASSPAHLRETQPPLALREGMTLDDLAGAAAEGHPLVLGTLARAARYLGIAIGNLINIVNPSHVVIGGSLAAFGDVVLVPLRAEIQQRALWDAQTRLTIAPSRLGDDVGPIGGAALCLNRIGLSTLLSPSTSA